MIRMVFLAVMLLISTSFTSSAFIINAENGENDATDILNSLTDEQRGTLKSWIYKRNSLSNPTLA